MDRAGGAVISRPAYAVAGYATTFLVDSLGGWFLGVLESYSLSIRNNADFSIERNNPLWQQRTRRLQADRPEFPPIFTFPYVWILVLIL